LVELAGETVCVPLTGTSPMPSMLALVAPLVRQFRTTDWPWSMESGSAVMVAVGGAPVVEGAVVGVGAIVFLWQPVTASRETVSPNIARVQTDAGRVVMAFSFSDQTFEIIGCKFRNSSSTIIKYRAAMDQPFSTTSNSSSAYLRQVR
jgi:hypothetical protein